MTNRLNMDNITDQQPVNKKLLIQKAAETTKILTGMTLNEMAAPGRGRHASDARAIFIEAATRLDINISYIANAIKRSRATVLAYIDHYSGRCIYYNDFQRLADLLDQIIPPKKPTPCFFEPHLLRTQPPAPPHNTRLGFRFTSEEETRYRDTIAMAKIEAAERYVTILPD